MTYKPEVNDYVRFIHSPNNRNLTYRVDVVSDNDVVVSIDAKTNAPQRFTYSLNRDVFDSIGPEKVTGDDVSNP